MVSAWVVLAVYLSPCGGVWGLQLLELPVNKQQFCSRVVSGRRLVLNVCSTLGQQPTALVQWRRLVDHF